MTTGLVLAGKCAFLVSNASAPYWVATGCQIFVMAVLVIVTIHYAKSTKKIAESTEQNTASTERMAASTKLMADLNERLMREGEIAAIRYLEEEANINLKLYEDEYSKAAKADGIDPQKVQNRGKLLGDKAKVRFSISGRELLPKAATRLGETSERLLSLYATMQAINARVDEYYATLTSNPTGALERLGTALAELAKHDFSGELERAQEELHSKTTENKGD